MRALLVSCVLALLTSGSAMRAQIVELSGGASTLFDAQGASLHVRSGNMDTQLGIGLSSGHFAAGGAAVRTLKNGSLTMGQQELRADVPTDVFDTRHTLFGTGIGLRQASGGRSLVAFTGFTSLRSGTPLFQAVDLGKLSHFTQFHTRLGTNCGQTLTGMSGSSTVELASVECSPVQWFTWAATAGVGAKAPYAAASAVVRLRDLDLKLSYVSASEKFQRGNDPLQPTPEPIRENMAATWHVSRGFQLSAARGHWTMPSSTADGSVQKSSMDSGGFGWEHRNLSVSATALRSSFDSGGELLGSGITNAFSSAIHYRMRQVEVSETLLHAQGTSGVNSTISSTTVSVQPNARIRLSEGINATSDGITFSHGGSLLTRLCSFDVDYQFYYVANRPDKPFQQGLLFRADVQLPGRFTASASSTITATGTPLYTFQIGRVFARERAQQAMSMSRMGQSTVRGHVEELDGKPVDRAAISIGNNLVYTDAAGDFLWRESRPQLHPFRVLTDEFVSADKYIVVEAPSEVRSGDSAPLRVVVRRDRPMEP